jgi:hypothetical protein
MNATRSPISVHVKMINTRKFDAIPEIRETPTETEDPIGTEMIAGGIRGTITGTTDPPIVTTETTAAGTSETTGIATGTTGILEIAAEMIEEIEISRVDGTATVAALPVVVRTVTVAEIVGTDRAAVDPLLLLPNGKPSLPSQKFMAFMMVKSQIFLILDASWSWTG